MVRFFHQHYLLECPYWTVDLSRYRARYVPPGGLWHYTERQATIFDGPEGPVRHARLSELDRTIATEAEWKDFVEQVRWLRCLLLQNDRRVTGAIAADFDRITLQAYLWRLQNQRIPCLYSV
jgi:hypothetical protein